MTTMTRSAPAASHETTMPAWLMLLIAAACGLIVANIYYAQPLIGPISAALGLSPQAAGLIVTMTQIGYGAGLLLVVPLGDLFENRRLVVACVLVAGLALAAAAAAAQAWVFLACSLVIGLGSVAVQVLVPYAASLAPEVARGRVVGNVMSGLMLGIMLARPVASFVTHLLGWQAIFGISAAGMVFLALILRLALRRRVPAPGLGYGALLGSMAGLLARTKLLRRRAFYHAFLFGAFSLFWTSVPLELSGVYRLTQAGIAWFGLAGVAGAVAAPIAGRLADRGWTRLGSALAMGSVLVAFGLARLGAAGSGLSLGLLVAAAILLDCGVTAHLVLAQRAIFSLGAEFRSRLNGLFMAIFFVGGALGSAVGGWAFAQGGWGLTTAIGAALPVAALLAYATEAPWRQDGAREVAVARNR
jgi:predicted MFS family arabinose efflux permease